MVKPVEEVVQVVRSPHIPLDGGTLPRAAAGDDLHPVPHLLHAVVLQLLLQLSPVLLLRLLELDSEFPLQAAELTESHSSIEPCVPLSHSSFNFLSFFNDKITSIRDKIDHLMPPTDTDSFSNTGILEVAVNPDTYLDCFSPIDLSRLTSTISTCLLDSSQLDCFRKVCP